MSDCIETMTDDELRSSALQCEIDLRQAAELAPNSERHEACFAALYCMCMEMNYRGMTPQATGVLQ